MNFGMRLWSSVTSVVRTQIEWNDVALLTWSTQLFPLCPTCICYINNMTTADHAAAVIDKELPYWRFRTS